MTKNTETFQVFTGFAFLLKYLFGSFAPLLVGLHVLCVLNILISLYILDTLC